MGMEITKTLYVQDRIQWRLWLKKNHRTEKEIWLVKFKKHSKKASIPYNDAVEEALCFGWIDSTVKILDNESNVQRYSPRRYNSALSEMNKERIRRLIKKRKMTISGLESIKHHLKDTSKIYSHTIELKEFKMPDDILKELKSDAGIWKNFQNYPLHYKFIRVGYIEGARNRPVEFNKRLKYFLKMTAKNKKFGMIQ
jgi:uncharacterized protein YdeI (YjbR/CyaY-like superfamily)